MATAKQPVSIDDIEFDALIDEEVTYESDVPSYPIESGFEVSDSIALKPPTISMTLFLTNTPVTWKERHRASSLRVQEVLDQLRELYYQKKPVTITTSEMTYYDMPITSINLKKSTETGTSREIPIAFKRIRVTESQTTDIPDSYRKSGRTGIDMGMADITESPTPEPAEASASTAGYTFEEPTEAVSFSPITSGSKGSILYGLASGMGLLK